MGPRKSLRLTEEGWTLVELMLVTAMIAIITPAITFLFLKSSQGFASDEMHTQIARGNEYMMSRVENRLSASKHFFQGGTSMGASFVAAIAFSSAPATVAGTQLAQAQTSTSGSFDPTTSGFQPLYMGNSMFFGAYDVSQTFPHPGIKFVPVTFNGAPLTIAGQPQYTIPSTPAPLTVSGAGITDGAGTQETFIIDLYRFYYYYLTPSTHNFSKSQGVSAYGLEEWQSIQYLDYAELTNLPDATSQAAAVSYCLSQGLTIAWDSSQQAVTIAFYTIAYAGTSTSSFTQITSPSITQAAVTYLCQVPSGILSNGFSYGISPNTSTWINAPSVTVPKYATASGQFPGGFEVGVSGTPSGREIFLRSCWVALGAAPKVGYNDLTSVQNIRDQW